MSLLQVRNIHFSYDEVHRAATLKGVSFDVEKGELIAIQGRSGSGKSTLFYVLGCLLVPEEGSIQLAGRELVGLSPDELAYVRNREIGFVFQQFHLLPKTSVLDNILLSTLYPCELGSRTGQRDRAIELANRLGLGDRLNHKPNELSGGEQQRVAIARALLSDADLILADEPTGNLDSENATKILELLKGLCREGKTIILITHDGEVANHCDRVLRMQDGVLTGGSAKATDAPSNAARKASLFPLRTLSGFIRLARAVAPMAWQNLRRNKVRALLTMVGVTIGIAALFSMITFGQFAKTQILKGYEELGVNTVRIRGYINDRRKASDKIDVIFQSFDVSKDLKPLLSLFPEIRLISPLLMSWHSTTNFGGNSVQEDVNIWGVGAEYSAIGNRAITMGRTITPYHIEKRSEVCLIGPELVEKLFRNSSPLGQIVFITKQDGTAYPCQVIGVLESQSSNQDWRKPNLEVVMPYTYFQTVNGWWEAQIHTFVVQLYPGKDVEKVSKGIKAYFEQKYGRSGDFSVDANTLLIGQLRKFLTLFTLLLSAIALVTLGVGGVGINNMMLVSIAERLKEIGLRKAMGATNRSIRIQFLFESSLLSAIAGLVGVLVGFGVYELVILMASKFVSNLKFTWLLDPVALAFSLISVIGVGIASGFVPALRAERLHVIEALRTE